MPTRPLPLATYARVRKAAWRLWPNGSRDDVARALKVNGSSLAESMRLENAEAFHAIEAAKRAKVEGPSPVRNKSILGAKRRKGFVWPDRRLQTVEALPDVRGPVRLLRHYARDHNEFSAEELKILTEKVALWQSPTATMGRDLAMQVSIGEDAYESRRETLARHRDRNLHRRG